MCMHQNQTFTAPNKPVIDNVIDDIGNISGIIAPNGITDDTKPTLKWER